MCSVPSRVVELIETFDRHVEAYHSQQYKEAQLCREFIDPFFHALGWDVANEKGYAQAYKEVIHEDAIKIGGYTKAPDYCFRIGPVRKFFLEAKKPSIDIKGDPHPAYQLRRYAWSAKLPLSILTDFEEFAVYDCQTRPRETDKADTARIMYITYKHYPENWAKIADVFSRESILKGSFDKFAASTKAKRGTTTVDTEFLAELEKWRAELARIIALRNTTLSTHEINFAVQRTIDRIIFLRMAEDRGIESYGQLLAISSGNQTYPRLCGLFEKADHKYNSGLFYFQKEAGRPEGPDELTLNLVVDDNPLKYMLHSLYYPQCPYEFSVLPAEILGNVYEQFLGSVITISIAHRAKVEPKPEVKKAGGVYYTPAYIVNYIVKNTVGKLVEGKTPKQTEKLKILDPACGSGSFLLGAYTHLLNYHRDWYVENDPKKHTKQIYQGKGSQWFLTITEKKRILLNNIFGIDIDSQAVEVTKLSLLLKVLEGETSETVGQTYKIFHERALPDLGNNIKCGNSLIGPDFYENKDAASLNEELQQCINPFDWQAEFPQIFSGKNPGFDTVIGNPPYGVAFTNREKDYLKEKYQTKTYDSAAYFLQKACDLARRSFAMIVPKSIAFYNSWFSIRKFLLDNSNLNRVADVGLGFQKVNYEQIILCFEKEDRSENIAIDVAEPVRKFKDPKRLAEDGTISRSIANITGAILFRGISQGEECVLKKVMSNSLRLGDICKESFRALYIPDPEKERLSQGKFLFINKVPDVGRYELRKVLNVDLSANEKWLARAQKCLKPKIFFKVLRGKKLVAYPDAQGIYVPTEKLVVFCVDEDKFPISYLTLAGIINSKVPSFVIQRILFSKTRETSRVMDLTYSRYLPIPRLDFQNPEKMRKHDRIAALVERMLDLNKKLVVAKIPDDKTRIQRQIATTDKQIDNLVYELYGLTDKEIAIIEGKGE